MKGLFHAIILIAMVLGIGSFCVLLRQKNANRGTYLRVVTDKLHTRLVTKFRSLSLASTTRT